MLGVTEDKEVRGGGEDLLARNAEKGRRFLDFKGGG